MSNTAAAIQETVPLKNTPNGPDTGRRIRTVRSVQRIVDGPRTGESQRTLRLQLLAESTNLPLQWGWCFIDNGQWDVRSRSPFDCLQRNVSRSF